MNINPFLATDGYKTGHAQMYPQGTSLVYSNWTPRHGKHSNVENSKGVVVFGIQMVLKQIHEMFDKNFFMSKQLKRYPNDKEDIKACVCQEIKEEYSLYLGTDFDVSHIEALWDLGHLPIKVKALPEGSFCPYGVPCLTVVNTLPEFFWLTNFLETLISNMLWLPMTSATTALEYKKILKSAALKTDKTNLDFVDFQGHNFSMRGMAGLDATVYSGLGHSLFFKGDDSLPTISAARKYYDAKDFVVGSVNATEHSVMCAGGNNDELGTFRYLMKQFPTGILSIVSDTWDLWKVLTGYLPELKQEILDRDGKIVIRPDSGDPVDIICGELFTDAGEYLGNEKDRLYGDDSPKNKGVVELLWDVFGGTINDQGYKVLDPHIGVIYGDSITPQRAKSFWERLEQKGFASTNIVVGVGSYTYQFVTRDTHGFAMKATYVEIKTGETNTITGKANIVEGRPIFKDPITGDGSKKSAKGLLKVYENLTHSGDFISYGLLNNVTKEEEEQGALKVIYNNGKHLNLIDFETARLNANKLV